MHAVSVLRTEIAGAREILTRSCPDVDRMYLMMQADRFYAERQHQAILDWLPKLEQRLDEIVRAYEAELAERDRRIADLEAQTAQLGEIEQAPHLHAVD